MQTHLVGPDSRQSNNAHDAPALQPAKFQQRSGSIAAPWMPFRHLFVLSVTLALGLFHAQMVHAQTDPTVDKHNNVTWTKKSSAKPPIVVSMGKGNVFYWTDGSNPDQNGNQKFEKDDDYGSFQAANGAQYKMYRPKSADGQTDKKVEDYHLEDSRGNSIGGLSFASADGSFKFQPLDNLATDAYSVPWFASLTNGPPIYMAVDLGAYMSSNPNPFGSFTLGQNISTFGVLVINGQINGVRGLYFATSELVYDPTSGVAPITGTSGWLDSDTYQSEYGAIGVIGSIGGAAAPEPSSLMLVGSAIAGLSGLLRKRLLIRS